MTIPESEISLEQQITISSAFARAEHFSFDLLEPDDADVELTFEQRYEQEYLHAEHDGASAKSAASCADEADFHVREFLRFLALKSVRPDVTPSVVVDNVFHLALTYTVAYAHLCALVGGTFIHHDPTPGGDAANARYMRQYEDALELYALAFGAPPPRSVWPPVAERMDPQRDWRLVARSRVRSRARR
ncbi:phenylacetate-CoA ligase [Aureococcus anophagefferens]|nr:phenylacetate-CoA ligase [Aureococcus anophagefferens]